MSQALNCRLKDQPSRDDAPSKGANNVVHDNAPSQGTDATSGTSSSPAKGGAKPAPGETTRRTFSTFRSFESHLSQNQMQLTGKQRELCSTARVMAVGPARAENQDSSRDNAAKAEAINVDKGVASGSTRKDPESTGEPSEAAPTASEVVPPNVEKEGLQGTVEDAQGNLQDTKNKQVSSGT